MKDKGSGQYDIEYTQCACFWGTEPGKFVKLIPGLIGRGNVLDLGCGEGKNAVYLAEHGFNVVAVDCSEPGLRNFRNRLEQIHPTVAEKIEIFRQDVRHYAPPRQFDVVIAYGLLHCLSSIDDINDVVTKMQSATREGGLNVAVTFTDVLGVPSVQDYLEPTLLPVGFLEGRYSAWEVLLVENAIIEETHPTSAVAHQHSLCRIIAQKRHEARRA